jgi:3-hydroxy-9,10-secoandrosta-1,3,5(10)-triene-9,17-dione monooxygenase reductase component
VRAEDKGRGTESRPTVHISPADFRHVLGHLPTGVTIVAADTPNGPAGMAANSVTSVSLDPPLILLCPAKSSTTWPHIRDSRRFCVSVMAGHHEALSRQFAARDADRFDGVAWSPRPSGPGFDDAIAWLDCDLYAEHDAGDHTIVVAAVVDLEARTGADPLVFFRGSYGTFSTNAGSAPGGR